MERSLDIGLAENSLFTESEKQILKYYDQLMELQLEIALVKASRTITLVESANVSEIEISKAQDELLKAKALYQISRNVTESVLIANPVIKAVFSDMGGRGMSFNRQNLMSLIEKRDELSLSLTQISKKYSDLKDELLKVEAENIHITSENTELTATVFRLAEAANSSLRDNESLQTNRELDEINNEVKLAQQKWKMMKGTISALIVGSGIDWARDDKLLQIVLEKDHEPTFPTAKSVA